MPGFPLVRPPPGIRYQSNSGVTKRGGRFSEIFIYTPVRVYPVAYSEISNQSGVGRTPRLNKFLVTTSSSQENQKKTHISDVARMRLPVVRLGFPGVHREEVFWLYTHISPTYLVILLSRITSIFIKSECTNCMCCKMFVCL